MSARDLLSAAGWRSPRGRPGDDRVEPVNQGGVPCGFVGPPPLRCVLGELLGVGSLGGEDGEHAGLGAEVGAVLADVGVGADALGGGPQAVPPASRDLIRGSSRQSPSGA